MTDLARVTHKIFAGSAAAADGGIGKFGSLAAAAPVFTVDPAVAMGLAAWLAGWNAAILGKNAPPLEDRNAVDFVHSRQIAYLLQKGISEYDSGTSYYTNDIVRSGLNLFVSMVDNHSGHALPTDSTASAYWRPYGKTTRLVTGTDSFTSADDILYLDTSGGTFVETTASLASTYLREVRLKWTGGTVPPTLKGAGTDNIDGANTASPFRAVGDAVTLFNDSIEWRIF